MIYVNSFRELIASIVSLLIHLGGAILAIKKEETRAGLMQLPHIRSSMKEEQGIERKGQEMK